MHSLGTAATFFFDPFAAKVMLHFRDKHTLFMPNQWSSFGGALDPGESPMEALLREIHEETELRVSPTSIIPIREAPNQFGSSSARYATLLKEHTPLTLREGAGYGWFAVGSAFELPNITRMTREDLTLFLNTITQRKVRQFQTILQES